MERLIKEQAIQLAGAFYERNRSNKFRRAYPTVQHYLGGTQVMVNSNFEPVRIKIVPKGWMHHVVLARRLLVEMLKQPDGVVTPHMKDEIADALIRDRGKSLRFGKRIHQKMERDDYGEKSVTPAAG